RSHEKKSLGVRPRSEAMSTCCRWPLYTSGDPHGLKPTGLALTATEITPPIQASAMSTGATAMSGMRRSPPGPMLLSTLGDRRGWKPTSLAMTKGTKAGLPSHYFLSLRANLRMIPVRCLTGPMEKGAWDVLSLSEESPPAAGALICSG